MFKFLRRKPKAEGFLVCSTIESLKKTPKNIVPETKEFIEKFCETYTNWERKNLEIETRKKRFTMEELFLMKYGYRTLRFEPKHAMIFACIIAGRGYCERERNKTKVFGTDEVLDRFEDLFLEENNNEFN